jgi:hypothetical protein
MIGTKIGKSVCYQFVQTYIFRYNGIYVPYMADQFCMTDGGIAIAYFYNHLN